MVDILVVLFLASAIACVIICVSVYIVIPAIIRWQYSVQAPSARFKVVDGSEGAGSSDLRYFILSYDCRREDLKISAELPDAPHWQIGLFDGSMRLVDGGYVNHHTAVTRGNRFEVVVSKNPEHGEGSINCASSTRGLLIYRVLCPRSTVLRPTVEKVRTHQ